MGIVIRQSIKGIIVNYVGAFIGFLSTFFVVTRFLAPEEIGLTRVLLEASALVGAVAMMGTSSSIMRFFPYFRNPENRDNGFFFYILLLPALGILICIPLYLLLKTPIIAFFSKNSSLYIDYYYCCSSDSVYCVLDCYGGIFDAENAYRRPQICS